MPSPLPWLVLASVVAPGAPSAAPADADELIEAWAGFAHWACDAGAGAEGRAAARRVLRAAPHHPVAGLLVRPVADGDGRPLPAPVLVELRRRSDDLQRRMRSALAAAEAADAAADLGRVCAWLDPELPGLEPVLRRAGLRLVAGWGALPGDELAALEAGLAATCGGRFLAAGELRAARRDAGGRGAWLDALGVRTPHVRLLGNVAPALLARVAAACERFVPTWRRLAAEAALPLVGEVPLPLEVRVLDSWASFAEQVPDPELRGACARCADLIGIYALDPACSCAYLADDTPAGHDVLLQVVRHELAHQMFHRWVGARAHAGRDSLPLSWIEEATCMHLEHVGAVDDDVERGMACLYRDHDPLARIARVQRCEFGAVDDYGALALLADLLLRAPDQAATGWRRAFLAALRRDLIGEQQPDRGELLRELGLTGGALRAALERHAEAVQRR